MDQVTQTNAGAPRRAEESRRWYPATLAMVGLSAASFTVSTPRPAEAAPVVTAIPASAAVGASLAPQLGLAAQVRALKHDSGLTWAQFAALFGVTPRAVHFWVEGGRITSGHQERLERVRQVLGSIDAATPSAAREALFTVVAGGHTPYALLVAETHREGDRDRSNSMPFGFEESPSGVGVTGRPVATEDIPGFSLRPW